MALNEIAIPDSIKSLPLFDGAGRLIDHANDRIEAFMLQDQEVIENFVTCDFHLVDQSMTWIDQQHLRPGNRFCELGSGFGVVAMLAAIRGMESVGIEIEQVLVDQSNELADDLDVDANFYCGSFVPRDAQPVADSVQDIKHVETLGGDVYDEIGMMMNDFDLFFAFPWPGEHLFFEAVFEACAADGALLLTYRGREGTSLTRKQADSTYS